MDSGKAEEGWDHNHRHQFYVSLSFELRATYV